MTAQLLFNRWDVAQRVVTLARADVRLVGVTIEPGWPGEDRMAPDMIWIDELAGELEYPFSQAGRKTRNDHYTVPFHVRVVDRVDLDATMTRLQELVGVLDDIIAEDPTAAECPGVMQALATTSRLTCGQTPDGPMGFAEVVLAVFARYL